MLVATWRISGRSFKPSEFCQRFKLKPTVIFNRGQRHILRSITTPGCNISIPVSHETVPGILSGIKRFVNKQRTAFLWLKRNGIGSEIDVGMSVGASPHFTHSVTFDPKVLALLARMGVPLRVSGYPVSDD